MIKVFCNKCGREITGNVNTVAEETEAIDIDGNVVAKWKEMLHYCDECQDNELTCGFKIGDKVITDDGRVGVIESICDCEHCKKRGFYEPRVKMTIGNDTIWITDTDKENGFISFYKIGDQIFGNIDGEAFERIEKDIVCRKNKIKQLEEQLKMLRTIDKHYLWFGKE